MNTQSENINELMTAMAKAQGQIESAKKDKTNPFFKSSYADLSSIWDACRAALSENGLAIVQSMEPCDGVLILVTTLGHSSGQWMKSHLPVITQKSDHQSLGSAITYMRRYSLSAMVGVAPEDDDDGEKAMGSRSSSCQKVVTPELMPYKQQKPAPVQKISKEQVNNIENLLNGQEDMKTLIMTWVKKDLNGETLADIPRHSYKAVLEKIVKHRNSNSNSVIEVKAY